MAVIVSPAAHVVIAPGASVDFRGGGTDSDGSVVAWRWTFDGAAADSTAQNPGLVAFPAAGAYHVYLLVTDDTGVMNYASRWVFVSGVGSPGQPTGLAAFHRAGQTFITWTENGALTGESYRVYRHTSPITASNLGEAQILAQVAEDSSRCPTEPGGCIGQTRFIIQDKSPREEEGLGPELAAGTGLFVYTVHNTESNSFYYAVTTVSAAGQENRADFSSANRLDAPVGEAQAVPRAVHVHTAYYGNNAAHIIMGQAYTLFMDYDQWNPKYIGYAYNFTTSVSSNYPSAGTNRVPLVLHVEGWGSRYSYTYVNELSITVHGDDARQVWYYGYGGNLDPSAYHGGFVANYQEKFLIEAVLATMRDPFYRVDTNRIYMYGHSMGGSGTLTVGSRYPKLFAATYSSEPMTDYLQATTNAGGTDWLGNVTPKWGPTNGGGDPVISLPLSDPALNDIARYNGTPVFDWQNTQLNIQKRVKDEMPYIQTAHNTDDTVINWATEGAPWYDLLENSNAPKRAWSGWTGTGGHRWIAFAWNGRMMINDGPGEWVDWQFRNFEAMPGLGRCARSDAAFVSWSASWYPQGHPVTLDTAPRFEMTLISGTGSFAADVTPRRRQHFLPPPGQLCAWSNVQDGVVIASGTVAADSNGLVTVTNFAITTGGNRLVLTTDVPLIPEVAIASSTHPDGVPTPSRDAALTWSAVNGIAADGFSWAFDLAPTTTPDTVSEGTGASFATNGLDNGTYYLHVRGHGADGWGAAAHYAVVVDEFEGHWREAPALPDPTGRVVRAGTAAAFQAALDSALTGDTIVLSNGIYEVTRFYVRGTNLTIRGLTRDPSAVVLRSRPWDDATACDETDDLLRFQQCDDVTLADLTLGECHAYAAKLEHENGPIRNVRFHHCRFVDNGTRGIKGTTGGVGRNSGGRVEYCSFQNYKTPPASWNSGGDYITSMDCMELEDWTVRDCYFRDIRGRNGGGRGAVFVWGGSSNVVVERCAFVGCDRSIAFGNPSGDAARPHVAGGIIRNNFIAKGADAAIELSSVTGIQILHNTVWTEDPVNGIALNCPAFGFGVGGDLRNNILRGRLSGSYGGLAQSGNVPGATVAAAWFRDGPAADLRLASDVTDVVDRVTAPAASPTDWDGHYRPTGAGLADAGADEYGSAVQIPAIGIASATHAEGVPTANRNALFTWRVLNGVDTDGFSFLLDQAAGTEPDTASEGGGTNVACAGLADGTYYLHVRGHGPDGWGGAAHYRAIVYFDTIPPVVTNVTCSSTTNSITVTWLTDEPAGTIVRYGTANNWSTADVTQRDEAVTTHAMTLAPLPPGTLHYLWIGAVDAAGNRRLPGVPDACAATLEAGQSGTQTVALRRGADGYTGCADGHIFTGQPDSNFGADTSMQVGGPDNIHPEMSEYRPLLDFDLSDRIPAGVTVLSATLSVLAWGSYLDETNHSVAIHALSRSFAEDEATWNRATAGQAWTAVGGDYGPALAICTLPGSTGWLTYDVGATVQGWASSPSSRHGFILVHQDDWKYLALHTSEHETVSNRPMLIVSFAMAAPVVRIASSTHPDGTRGYAATSASLQWSVVNGMPADGYSLVFDRTPTTVPDTVAEGGATTWTTNALTAGAWYMHVRGHGVDGWGPAAHFAIHVGPDPDTDGDGASDVAEAAAGTNPLDEADLLMLVANATSTPGLLELRWAAKAGRSYRLQHAGDLFSTFTNLPALEWTPASNGVITCTGDVSGASIFYRVSTP